MLSTSLPVAASALLCTLTCCHAPPPTAPDTLVVALESRPATLDPRFATDANAARLSALVAGGLTRGNARSEMVPDLARSWQQPSPTEYIFTLRDDARFHDGRPVTAHDVAATYRSVADPRLRSPKREALRVVESVRTPDTRTVTFQLREPSAAFLEATGLGILPADVATTGPLAIMETVGAGPFRVDAVLQDGGVDLVPSLYAMDGPPSIPRLRFRIVPDGVVRALELASGAVHFVQNALEPDILPWLGARPGLEIVITPGTTFQYLGVNFRDTRLAKLPLRRAIAHAIDREGVARHLLRGTARSATGLLPPSHWAYTAAVSSYALDRARARALVAEAGLAPELRRLSYKTSTVELRRRIAEVFQADLAAIGLGLDIRSYEWATFYEDIRRGNFELYSLAWVGVQDPDVYRRVFHSAMQPPAGNNRGGYVNARLDAILDEANRTLDRPTRRSLYAEAQRIVADDLPIIPLWWSQNVIVKSTRLHDFESAPDGDLRSFATAAFAPPDRHGKELQEAAR